MIRCARLKPYKAMTPRLLPIEILLKGEPYKVVDVPVLGTAQITKQDIIGAERRAFWAIISQRQHEPEEITTRYAPHLKSVG